MKNSTFLAHLLATLSLFAILSACSSDRSPVDYINFDGPNSKDAKTYIQLSLNPSSTRAIEENKISSVNIYVFNAADKSNVYLEKTIAAQPVESNNVMLDLDVDAGSKVIYAITAYQIFDDIEDNITLQAFESKIIQSSKLQTSTELVMVGKQEDVDIKKTNSIINIPESNILKITLERLLAKVDISRVTNLFESDFGFSVNSVDYKICQTRKEVRLSKEIFASFEDSNGDGTYDAYDPNKSGTYVSVGATSGNSVQYVAENLVDQPKSGNTTFVSLRVKLSPTYWFAENSFGFPQLSTSAYPEYNTAFFAIGVFDSNDNFIEYLMTNNKIPCFSSKKVAEIFINNGDSNNGIKPAALTEGYKYAVVEFSNRYAYYRVNISDGNAIQKKYGVERNTHYNIKINKISALGAKTEDDLFPKLANSSLENGASMYTMSESSFEIKTWSEINDNVDL